MKTWIQRDARRIHKARLLLAPAVRGAGGLWADIGCGEGVFTFLLFDILQPGSKIYAVDKSRSALQRLHQNIAESVPGATVQPILADFTHPLSLPPLDGVVLANALHFVRDKARVLQQLVSLLKSGGRLIVIEYNTWQGNSAVPYPIDEARFLTLAREIGLPQARIVTRVPSTFLGEMYTGLAVLD